MPAAGDAATVAAACASARPPVSLRSHQQRVLATLESMFAGGHRRAWVVLPPGLGKTLTGLEAARRLGRRTVVLGPNTAIQGQWVAEWSRFTPAPPRAGTSRALDAVVNVLTYQALATFDPDSEAAPGTAPETADHGGTPGGAHLRRLRPQGRALVAALRAAGEVTLLLDECHHLLETWGELLAEILRELPMARVIGLTATPPEGLSRARSALAGELFGRVVRGPSIPAAVRDGQLAPYAELAWLTQPTPEETAWLGAEAERFTELTTRLLDPGFASVPFLEWLDRRVVRREARAGPPPAVVRQPTGATGPPRIPAGPSGEGGRVPEAPRRGPLPLAPPPLLLKTAPADPAQVRSLPESTRVDSVVSGAALGWQRFSRDHPELSAAALRFHHRGLLALPEGARLREEHRRPPDAADWVCLLDDWVRRCLRRSGLPGDRAAEEAIRAALPAVGYRLTAQGVRAARSPVDRVMARSAAKTAAVREILATESVALGGRLRAVVVTDHERAVATPPEGLTGVMDTQAGAARLVLEEITADARTAALQPLLVTGRTVAAAPETARRFIDFCRGVAPSLALRTSPAEDLVRAVEITGRWNSGTWVPLATRFFERGATRALIGTRGLLGEGWNARRVTTLVDLTESTTQAAVVQTRGRALRLDPQWPQKTATTWSVVCVAAGHPRGTGDWRRFVRKHEGYLGVTGNGTVMSGVAHVDPALSPYSPPPPQEFDAFNAAMRVRAERRDHIRALWKVGESYDDALSHTVRVTTPQRRPARAVPAPTLPSAGPPPPAVVPAAHGTLPSSAPDDHRARLSSALFLGALAGGGALAAGLAPVLLPLPGVVASLAGHHLRGLAIRVGRLRDAAREPVVPAVAWAVADGLRAAGLSPRGAEAVVVEPDHGGAYQLRLDRVPAAVSERFAIALDEALAPLAAPRYLAPRYVIPDPLGRVVPRRRENTVVYHAVPSALGENRARVEVFMDAWRRRVSDGEWVYTHGPEGAGVLAAQGGRSPLDVTTALRLSWS